ncbi:hypothetical protein ECE50_021005 [Chitinophaga sp. Mgbs1]|uniref:Uncharacterized protein n=1 Tax=Chitinophaga solisilvae TaxID=1233460 RepID=A0A9Q5D7E2_9BACT|nr:hypothetical protein [Chitinophaga solisilvae]
MFHFVTTYVVTIDGSNSSYGITGTTNSVDDPKRATVKRTIEEQYRKRHPEAKHVAVVIQHIQPVDQETYYKESENFLPII